jgi:hypothetical protein
MLKAALHFHTREDPEENISYSANEALEYAAEAGFNVVSITNHEVVTFNDTLEHQAQELGILLIPGVELKIKGKEVLLYNLPQEEVKKIKDFRNLRALPQEVLRVAPHPFFWSSQSLGRELIRNISAFDAIEFSGYYIPFLNFNKPALKLARQFRLPLIGTSDAHALWQLTTTYSFIEAKSNISDIFRAIREGRVAIQSKPLSFNKFLKLGFCSVYIHLRRRIKRLMGKKKNAIY